MDIVLEDCGSCGKETTKDKLNKVYLKTGKPLMVCSNCAVSSFTGKELTEKAPKDHPEVVRYMSSFQKVQDPDSVPHPITGERKTQGQLFAEYLMDEQVKVDKLFQPDENGVVDEGLAYAKLQAHIEMIESIAFEARVRASVGLKKKRELDAASGKNRWDKERKGEDSYNLSDPRSSPLLAKANKDKKSDLSKLEKLIKGFIDLDMSDQEIRDSCPGTKFKVSEVNDAIRKLR